MQHCAFTRLDERRRVGAVAAMQRRMAEPSGENSTFNWSAAEEQVADIIEPAFVDDNGPPDVENERDVDVLAPGDVKLVDVAGMTDVKADWMCRCWARSVTRN